MTSYRARRTELRDRLRNATDDHRRACVRQEAGEAAADAVAAARALVTTVEERLLGLDTAWAEAEREARAVVRAADRFERGGALARIGHRVADRDAAAAKIEQAMKPLKAAIAAFNRANEQIIAEARPHAKRFGDGGLGDFRGTVFPSPPAEQAIIGGLLHDAGLRLDGIDLHQAWLDLQDGGLADAVRRRGARILAEASVILPDGEEEQEEEQAA